MEFTFGLELSTIDTDCPLFIRFGDIPKDERSFIRYRNYECGYEQGVSVYSCTMVDGLPQLVIPYPYAEGIFHTLWDFLEYRDRNVYLVTGTQIGTGYDNEPLLTNVKIIQDITELWKSDVKNYDAIRHKQLIARAEQHGFVHN